MDTTLRAAAKEFMVRYGGNTFPNLFRSAKAVSYTHLTLPTKRIV